MHNNYIHNDTVVMIQMKPQQHCVRRLVKFLFLAKNFARLIDGSYDDVAVVMG
jgi:hypothetical protein